MIQSGFHFDGKDIPFSALPDSVRSELGKFALGGMPRNSIRKSLYSALIKAGVGTEIIALIFEHGANAILPIGPLAFYPMSWIFESSREYLEILHEQAGLPLLLQDIKEVERQYGQFTRIDTLEIDGTECAEFDSLPGISLFSVPTQLEFELVETAIDEFIRMASGNCKLSHDCLRSGMALMLSRAGVPSRNLIRHRCYYKINSFVSTSGPLHFVAVMPQADLGLGLIPVSMGELSDVTKLILLQLKASGRNGLFDGRVLSMRETGGFIASLLRSRGVSVKNSSCNLLARAWVRVSNFHALWKLGGMLTAGLASKLILPSNYYDIGDLLNNENNIWQPLTSYNGSRWENPYTPGTRPLTSHLSVSEMSKLLVDGRICGVGRIGRSRILSPQFAKHSLDWTNNQYAAFIARHNCWPTRKKIESLLTSVNKLSASEAKSRANKIFSILHSTGSLHAGRPLRFLPSNLIPDFLKNLMLNLHSSSLDQSGHFKKTEGWILGGAALAMRIGEALVMHPGDYERIGNFETMHIRGTKTRRAKRTFPLHLAQKGPHGMTLVTWFLDVLKHFPDLESSSEVPFSHYKNQSGKRASDALAPVMDKTFREFRGIPIASLSGNPQIDGTYTHHSLRHAGAIRMLQGVLDSSFLSGNLWSGVSELALSMGQTLHTHLCSYVGTAALILKRPIK